VLTASLRIHPNPERFITLHNVLSVLHEMGRSSGTYGGQERCIQVFGGVDLVERDHLLDLGVDVRIILTLSLLMSYIYEAPCKTRNINVVCIWTYVWQR
jgi:hypothetical protein